MKFLILNFDTPIMQVEWDKMQAKSEWLSEERHIKIPKYLYPENITIQGISRFCESRQPPRTRYNIEELLTKKYKLKAYLPIQMCRISHGITHSDDLWLLFEGQEQCKYAEISVR